MRNLFWIWLVGQLASQNWNLAQEYLKEQAISEFVQYETRSEKDLGDFYLHADVSVQSTPDSLRLIDERYQFEKLVFDDEKLRWLKLSRESLKDDPPIKAFRTSFGIPCQKQQMWRNGQMYQKLSLGNWILTTEERTRSYCQFHDIFDWPFLDQQKLAPSKEIPRFSIASRTCNSAIKNSDGLLAEWFRADGKGFAKHYTLFRDGLPVKYQQVGFLGPIGDKSTDLRNKRILSEVETNWKKFDQHQLPTKVSAVIVSVETGERELTLLVDAKFDWKLGKDIPQKLIDELNEIAATTK